MMNKGFKIVCCAALLLWLAATGGVRAQRIHAYVTGGFTASQIEGDELRGFRKYGFSGGVGALVPLGQDNRWGASVEVLYAQHGARSTADTRYYLYKLDLAANYVEIPLLVHWQDPWGGMLVGAGLCYGRLLDQPHGEVGYDPYFFMPDTTDMRFLKNDLSAVLDARFTIWRGLQLGLRWQHSLLPIKRDWEFLSYNGYEYDEEGVQHNRYNRESNNCYNHNITVRLIYQF